MPVYGSSEIKQIEYFITFEDGRKQLVLRREDDSFIDVDVSGSDVAPPNLVFDGDSQSVNGIGVASVTEYGDTFPALVTSGIDPRSTIFNTSVGGRTIETMILDAANVDSLLIPASRNVLVAWAGTNDLYFGATAETTYGRIVAYHNARRTAGWKTVVYTVLSRTNPGTPVGYEAARISVNNSIRANWATFADALCDIALDTRLQTPGDTIYFSDSVHCTLTGRRVVSGLTKRALAKVKVFIVSNPQLDGLVSPAAQKGMVALGEGTLGALTTGIDNRPMGRFALASVTSGSYNTADGTSSLQSLVTGSYC